MSDSIRIRRMSASDLPAVMAIETEANPVPWSEAMFREAIRSGDADVWVAEVDGELIGYAVAWFVADLTELGNIAVGRELAPSRCRRAHGPGRARPRVRTRHARSASRDAGVEHGGKAVLRKVRFP